MVAQQYNLNAQRGFGGGGSSAEVADLLDQIDDLKAELRGCEAQRAELERTCETLEDQLQDAVDEIKIQHISIYQYKMFKAKAEFLERECGTQIKRLQNDIGELNAGGGMISLNGEGRTEALEDLLDSPDGPGLADKLKSKLREMAAAAAKAEGERDDATAEVEKMKSAGLGIDPDILEQLQLGDGATKKALMEVMKRFKDSNLKLMRLKDENDSLHKQNTMLQKRDDYNEELRNNWRAQLQQMEQAVMLCSQIHQKERGQYEAKLASSNNTIQTLKDWISKIKTRNNRGGGGGRNARGAGRIRMPVGRSGDNTTKTARQRPKGVKTVKRRKKRGSREMTQEEIEAKRKKTAAKRAKVQAAVGRD